MMPVLIDMEMPDSCGECPLHDGQYGWCNANTDIVMSFDERPRSCPLVEAVEIPDAVSRQAVLDKAYAYGNGYEPDGFCVDVEDIQALPSVQSEIIRCKDCKHHHYDGDAPYCDRITYGYGWKDDDYCSRAERKTNGDSD